MPGLVHLLEVLVALLDHVRCHVSVQVVDVMVLDTVSEGTKQKRNLKVSAALQCSACEVPSLFMLTIR